MSDLDPATRARLEQQLRWRELCHVLPAGEALRDDIRALLAAYYAAVAALPAEGEAVGP